MAVNVEVSNLKVGAAWELVHVGKLSGYCLRGGVCHYLSVEFPNAPELRILAQCSNISRRGKCFLRVLFIGYNTLRDAQSNSDRPHGDPT